METAPVPPSVPAPAPRKLFPLILGIAVLLAAAGGLAYAYMQWGPKAHVALEEKPLPIPYEKTEITIAPAVSADFETTELSNLAAMEDAYGVTFTQTDLARLAKDKFVVKNLLDTNVRAVSLDNNDREFVALYERVAGPYDYKERTPANAVFLTSDAVMHLFSILSVELLKETENAYLYPQISATTKELFESASAKAAAPLSGDRADWMKVRNYLAVPYALLSTSEKPFSAKEYWASGQSDVEGAKASFESADASADSQEKAVAFVRTLKLDAASESKVLADLEAVYAASDDQYVPQIFAEEYAALASESIRFTIPMSLAKPRGSYTGSSARRQYFRAVQWYQQIPFFVRSPELTRYALDLGALMNAEPQHMKSYADMSLLLADLIGGSDDLDVSDYAAASATLGNDTGDAKKLNAYLDSRKPAARIKSIPATYSSVGIVSRDEVIEKTRGMRFFSQKFIPDSYWTGKLTQGDEAPDVNGVRLPWSASSLEVMSILGSDYARASLPKLPYYAPAQSAVDTRLDELTKEAQGWGENYWLSNQVTSILYAISGLFSWQEENRAALPRFMQSPLWDAKTLATGSGFWTELRHTNILYAKQSFAEKGGGGGDCDPRKVPPGTVGYVEPAPVAYDRLYYAARLLEADYAERGITLTNLPKLKGYIELLGVVREYSKLELENAAFTEPTFSRTRKDYEGKDCTEEFVSADAAVRRDGTTRSWDVNNDKVAAVSRLEELRKELVGRMHDALPLPIEGPVLPMKDKRAALIVDVHASSNDGVVEEATGVPRMIFVAVKDANGPRLTAGFTYSHYEFLSPTRLTDEDWQSSFYTDEGGDYSATYKAKEAWPAVPSWYQELFGTR